MLCQLISLRWCSPRGGHRIITGQSPRLGPVIAVGRAGQAWVRRQQINVDHVGAFSHDDGRSGKCDRRLD
jgi:hypothetical protein